MPIRLCNVCTIRLSRVLIFDRRLWKSKVTSSKIYSHTLNLPQTKFPLSLKDGAAAKRERLLQKVICCYCKLTRAR